MRTGDQVGQGWRHHVPGSQPTEAQAVEEIFGWMKTVGGMRKLRHRGLQLVGWMFTLAGGEAEVASRTQTCAGAGFVVGKKLLGLTLRRDSCKGMVCGVT